MFRYLWKESVRRSLRISYREQSSCCKGPCYTYGLSSEEFKKRARAVVDFICKYNKEIACKPLIPDVKPGFLRTTLPKEPPQKPEKWDCIMKETHEKILPGFVPWQHPRFCGFHPTGNSYASILANWLSNISGSNGFSWDSSPVYTELEIIVADWYAKAMSIPQFYFHENKRGGGVIVNTTSECILTAMLAARHTAITKLKKCEPDKHESCFLPKLVAYYSKEAHSGVERACKLCMVEGRALESDDCCALRGDVLEEAIQADVCKGLIPFFVVATLGTPSVFSCDNLAEIGPIICRFCAWLHVDASYAGAAFICPEFRPLANGLEYSSSYSTSPHQWMLCHHDLAFLYVKEKKKLLDTMTIDPPYLHHPHTDRDFRNWGIPLSRRFRAIKLWIVLRDFGLNGVQEYLWNHMCLAKYFEELVKQDNRFEVLYETWFGVVCFRLCGSDEVNEKLVCSINQSNELFLTPTIAKCKYIIRFSVNYLNATENDICAAWEIIQKHASKLVKDTCPKPPAKPPGDSCQPPPKPKGDSCQPQCKPTCPPAKKEDKSCHSAPQDTGRNPSKYTVPINLKPILPESVKPADPKKPATLHPDASKICPLSKDLKTGS